MDNSLQNHTVTLQKISVWSCTRSILLLALRDTRRALSRAFFPLVIAFSISYQPLRPIAFMRSRLHGNLYWPNLIAFRPGTLLFLSAYEGLIP